MRLLKDERTGLGAISALKILITTAEAVGINPVDYLRDLLVRVDFEKGLGEASTRGLEGALCTKSRQAARSSNPRLLSFIR